MSGPRVVCLDIGTSSVRASSHDDSGRQARLIQKQYQWEVSGDGRVEQDPMRLERVIGAAIDELLADRRTPVHAVAVAAFWHSLLGVDRKGRPVTPVLPWTDARAHAEAEQLRRGVDERAVHRRTGCRLHPTYWPARLTWFRAHDRQRFRAVARWVSFPEWLEARWLGRDGVSISQASATGLMRQDTCQWDAALMNACGISERQLSPIVDIEDSAQLRTRWKARWPALASATWIPAVGDGALNNVGAGCVTRDRAALMIGTSGALRVLWRPRAKEKIRAPFGLWRYRLDRDRVIVGGALSNGGNAREWLLELTGGDTTSAAIARRANALAPDAHGLTVLPFFAGTRSPDYLPRATGTITGLTLATRPEHLLRAGMEAISYRLAAVFDELAAVTTIRRVVAAGGALERSRAWTQMLSDVLGRAVLMPRERELTARGAAALALERLGVSRIDDLTPPAGIDIAPDRVNHQAYAAARLRQADLMECWMSGGKP